MPTEITMKFSVDEMFVIRLALQRMREKDSGSRPVRDLSRRVLERVRTETGG